MANKRLAEIGVQYGKVMKEDEKAVQDHKYVQTRFADENFLSDSRFRLDAMFAEALDGQIEREVNQFKPATDAKAEPIRTHNINLYYPLRSDLGQTFPTGVFKPGIMCE
jgi:hypothetical protein